ncbi:SCO family protein [Pseudaquabacterium pictum]|uniref:Transmembrane protein n=1 Tax=Pseudaquabacterium pictum TaxID=2315236 RepID=A0A480ALK1_9BURK|nr:hypothetical protein [Rubrivivax pictus]GCL62273.1 hypothetical protein AQPW35_13540 [Rubrivivax pictus]
MNEPSEPLGLTVHSMPTPVDAMTRQRTSGRLKMLLIVAACAAPMIASYTLYYVVRPTGGATAYSDLIQPTVPMPAVPAQPLAGGAPQVLRGLAGQWLLVVVDSGACAEACEQRLYMQRQLREMNGRDRDRIDKLWLVIDDAPVKPALQQALAATPGMHMLRVPRATVAAWLKPAPGQALEDHLYIVDPLGEWMMRAPANADPSKLKRDITRLLRASGGWDQAGRQALIDDPLSAQTPTPAPASAPRP